jgi:CubicO group peptidase (beta-lactamase class C family)
MNPAISHRLPIAVCIIVTAFHFAPARAAAPVAADANARIEAVVKAEMAKRHIPGMQIAVVRGGKISLLRAYGVANLQYGVPVTDKTLFSLNSSTKSFTGVAVMQLVEQGKVKLDAPIGAYLPGLPATWNPVTVAQLLTHTSGLPDVVIQPKGQGTGSMVGEGGDASAWATVLTMPVEAAPGERYRYNQTNYALLGKLIAKVSGTPFLDFLRRHQFDAVGMPSAQYGDARDIVPGRAQSYRYTGGRIDGPAQDTLEHAFDDFSPLVRPAAGLNASARDVARWIIALQAGKLMRADTRMAMWSPLTMANGSHTRWAMGWPINEREERPIVQGIGGARSAFFVYPKDDLAIVVLTNLAGSNPQEFIDEIAGQFYPDLLAANGGGLPRAIKALRLELIKNGADTAPAAYAKLKKANPRFTLEERDMNDWGGKLMGANALPMAVAVFKLNTELYPASANTYDSLAEGYEASGMTAPAIANYKKSLELDDHNDHARDRLKVLR